MKDIKSAAKFIFQSILVGLALGFLIVFFKPELLNNNNSASVNPTLTPTSYAPAVNKIAPSVVSIYAQSEREVDLNPAMKRLMGYSSLVPQSITQQYLGSGVIMTADGYIVTNYHVINNATKIIVSLWDDTLLEGSVIGSDIDTDIAVLKIEALNLSPARFADSDQTQTGDIVMAVGSPYGLSQSVSLGIISAKGRSGIDVSTIENFIQTDAAINEGNSGGALINTNGEVVGISTATFNQNGAQGINFAIPSNATRLIIKEIVKNGKVLRGWIGVALYNPQRYYRSRIIKPEKGVLVYGVYRDSPALEVGLKQGDILTHVNEEEIKNEKHYKELIAQSKPGQILTIKGYSQGQSFEKQVQTVERLPDIR